MMLRKRSDPKTGTHNLCEPLLEVHVNISQEPVDTEIYGYNAADQSRGAHIVRA